MTLSNLLFFAATELVLCLTPGPAVLLVVSQAMRRGFRDGLRGALGILTGNTFYFALSATGLGALLLASTRVFEILRWAGAAYLAILGLKMLLFPSPAPSAETPAPATSRPFVQGVITQLANPKAIVFFTALLPQFIDPKAGNIPLQLLILGVVSILIELPVLATYAFATDRSRTLYSRHASVIERAAGACLVAAGVKLAMTK